MFRSIVFHCHCLRNACVVKNIVLLWTFISHPQLITLQYSPLITNVSIHTKTVILGLFHNLSVFGSFHNITQTFPFRLIEQFMNDTIDIAFIIDGNNIYFLPLNLFKSLMLYNN